MSEHNTRGQLWIGLALVAAMTFTRGQHVAAFGHHLPDATLVVFFLAGLYLRPGWAFPALFSQALLIDVAAVGWGGVGSFCISPAYVFLVPAYGAMWFAGRWYAGRHRFGWSTLIPLSVSLLGAAIVAELLASGGFYVFSGRFADPSLLGFGSRLVAYFPTTVVAVALYAVIAAALHSAVVCTRQRREGRLTTGHRVRPLYTLATQEFCAIPRPRIAIRVGKAGMNRSRIGCTTLLDPEDMIEPLTGGVSGHGRG